MRIYNNIASLTALNNLNKNQNQLNTAMKRLSTGLKINSAADDPAGLSVSTTVTSQITLSNAAADNNDGMNDFLNTADGALDTAGQILDKMNALVMRAADPTTNTSDKSNIATEYNALGNEVNSLLGANGATKFNGQVIWNSAGYNSIVDGSGGSMAIDSNAVGTQGGAMAYAGAGSFTTLITAAVFSNTGVTTALMQTLSAAITQIATQRGYIGADMARLQYKSTQLHDYTQNLQAYESRIRDTDMATEAANFSKFSILVQSTTTMLAQANARPQSALSLLQNL